jgi:hypothetical protein
MVRRFEQREKIASHLSTSEMIFSVFTGLISFVPENPLMGILVLFGHDIGWKLVGGNATHLSEGKLLISSENCSSPKVSLKLPLVHVKFPIFSF